MAPLLQVEKKQGELSKIKAIHKNLTESLAEQQAAAKEEAAIAEEVQEKIVACRENLVEMLPDGQVPSEPSSQEIEEMTDRDASELDAR